MLQQTTRSHQTKPMAASDDTLAEQVTRLKPDGLFEQFFLGLPNCHHPRKNASGLNNRLLMPSFTRNLAKERPGCRWGLVRKCLLGFRDGSLFD